MLSRRGASIGSVVLTLVGFGAVATAGWAVMTGNTPCQLIGSCSSATTNSSVMPLPASLTPASATNESEAATTSCCELGSLAESEPASAEGEIIPASLVDQNATIVKCAGEACDAESCGKGDACCMSGASAKNEDEAAVPCCSEHPE